MRRICAGFLRISGVFELRSGQKGDRNGLSPREARLPCQLSKLESRPTNRPATRRWFGIRRQGKVLHQEARRSHIAMLPRWAKQRGVALEDPSALVRPQQPSTKLARVIRWYIDSFQGISKWERSKQWQLLFLEPIGEVDAVSLESATLIDHVRSVGRKRQAQGKSRDALRRGAGSAPAL